MTSSRHAWLPMAQIRPASQIAVIGTLILLAPSAAALPPGFDADDANDWWPADPESLPYAEPFVAEARRWLPDWPFWLVEDEVPQNSCYPTGYGSLVSLVNYHDALGTAAVRSPTPGSVTRGPAVEITFDIPSLPRECPMEVAWLMVDGVRVSPEVTRGPLHYRLSYTLNDPLAYHGSPGWPSVENPWGEYGPFRPYTYHHVVAYWHLQGEPWTYIHQEETMFFHVAEWVRIQDGEAVVYTDYDDDYEFDSSENLLTVGPDRVTVGNMEVQAGLVSVANEGECARVLADTQPDDESPGWEVARACQASQDGCINLTHDELGANPDYDLFGFDPVVAIGTGGVRVCK